MLLLSEWLLLLLPASKGGIANRALRCGGGMGKGGGGGGKAAVAVPVACRIRRVVLFLLLLLLVISLVGGAQQGIRQGQNRAQVRHGNQGRGAVGGMLQSIQTKRDNGSKRRRRC